MVNGEVCIGLFALRDIKKVKCLVLIVILLQMFYNLQDGCRFFLVSEVEKWIPLMSYLTFQLYVREQIHKE